MLPDPRREDRKRGCQGEPLNEKYPVGVIQNERGEKECIYLGVVLG